MEAVDPFVYVGCGGTMPLANPPSACTGAPDPPVSACGYVNDAVIVLPTVFTPVTVTVSWHGNVTTQGVGPPTSITSCSPTKNPLIVAGVAPSTLTPTVWLPIPIAAASVTLVPGSTMRPACPTSCCSSSVALLTPACSCVRFQIVFCELVICRSACVTVAEII